MSDRLNHECIVCKKRYHDCSSCDSLFDWWVGLQCCSPECGQKVRDAAKARIYDKYRLTEEQMEELGELLKTAGY